MSISADVSETNEDDVDVVANLRDALGEAHFMNSGYPGRLVHCWLATIPQVGKPHTGWNVKGTLSNKSNYRLPMGLLYTGIATSGSYSDCRTLLPGGKVKLVPSGSSHSFDASLATIHLLSKPACLAMSFFTR